LFAFSIGETGVAAVEEIRSLIEAQNDPTMQELLFLRRLDPESVVSRTKMVSMYQVRL
jgi:hypothetical protein